MEIDIFELEPGRWGYRVGSVYQEWHPDRDGYVAMSQAEAEQCAAVVAARMAG